MAIITKQFVSFKTGVRISSSLIQRFLDDCVTKWKEGHSHWACSTGDTYVAFHAWHSSIDFIVATSEGYSRMSISEREYEILRNGEIFFDRNAQ